jgi:uncharacterized protein YkwD
MAAANKIDHDVHGSFHDRMSGYPTDHAAENIAMGNTTFSATLEQWKSSSGHRANLLIRDVSRIGIASAGSGHDTYWSLILAAAPKPTTPHRRPVMSGGIVLHEFKIPWPLSLFGH